MTTPERSIEINRQVRQILVQHWIDLGKLSISTGTGTVMIRGFLQRIARSDQPLTSKDVETMFGEIAKIQAVARVDAPLSNWLNTGRSWVPIGKPQKKPTVPASAAPAAPQSTENAVGV